jgi:hypothetical protein
MATPLPLPARVGLAFSALLGLVFVAVGIAWLTVPAIAAGALGASLLQGTGLATQIGDSASFFFCAGFFLLYGALTRSAPWLMGGALLIGLVAPARLVAWAVHDAALTLDAIVIESVIFVVIALTARGVRMSRPVRGTASAPEASRDAP